MFRRIFFAVIVALFSHLCLTHNLFAGPPTVRFDAPFTVAACDVTTHEFAATHPDEKLVEVVIPVSSLIQHGREEDLIQYLIQFDSPHQSCQVVDYMPQTTMATNVVGEIGIDRHEEHSESIGVTMNGQFQETLQGGANGNMSHSNASNVRYSMLPPLELLAASGTTHRGSGVFFKLRPSPRTSLEGSKDFFLTLRVPKTWRGDLLRLRCYAVGYNRGVTRHFDQHTQFGQAELRIALYAEGDAFARASSESLALAIQNMDAIAHHHQEAIHEARFPTPFHKWASEIELYDSDLPANWHAQITNLHPLEDHQRFAVSLPEAVDQAIEEYAVAKEIVYRLSQE